MSKDRIRFGTLSVALALACLGGCAELDRVNRVTSSIAAVPGVASAPGGEILVASTAQRSPLEYLTLATVTFLEGGESLMTATGHATDAARCRTVRENVSANGANRENLGEVNEIAASINEVAHQETSLKRADTTMLTRAAVQVGAATWFETLAVNASRNAVASGGARGITEVALVSTVAPTNLKSMMSVQNALYGYLKVKGIDPTVDVQSEISKLDKA